MRNRYSPCAPTVSDFPKGGPNYLVEKSRDAEREGGALEDCVKLGCVEPPSGIQGARPEILRSGDSG